MRDRLGGGARHHGPGRGAGVGSPRAGSHPFLGIDETSFQKRHEYARMLKARLDNILLTLPAASPTPSPKASTPRSSGSSEPLGASATATTSVPPSSFTAEDSISTHSE